MQCIQTYDDINNDSSHEYILLLQRRLASPSLLLPYIIIIQFIPFMSLSPLFIFFNLPSYLVLTSNVPLKHTNVLKSVKCEEELRRCDVENIKNFMVG